MSFSIVESQPCQVCVELTYTGTNQLTLLPIKCVQLNAVEAHYDPISLCIIGRLWLLLKGQHHLQRVRRENKVLMLLIQWVRNCQVGHEQLLWTEGLEKKLQPCLKLRNFQNTFLRFVSLFILLLSKAHLDFKGQQY